MVLDHLVVRACRKFMQWRLTTICVLVALCGAAAIGCKNLEFSSNYRVFFGDENPFLKDYLRYQETFGKDDTILFVVVPRSGDIFTSSTLSTISSLTEDAWKLPFATRVDSLANFQDTRAADDDIAVSSLVPATRPLTAEDIARIRDVGLSDPLLAKQLVAANGGAAGVGVSLSLPDDARDAVPVVIDRARALVETYRERHPDLRFAMSGVVPLNHAFLEATQADLTTLIPAMFAVFFIGVFLIVRTLHGTFVTLAVVALSAAAAMGLAGWFGLRLNPVSAAAPIIIATVSIADCLHILIAAYRSMQAGTPAQKAVIESLRLNFGPVFMTSLTTAIGFLSMNFSDTPPLRELGNIAAAGVVIAWLMTVTLIPALFGKAGVHGLRTGIYASSLERMAEYVIRQRRPILLVSLLVTVLSAWGITRIEFNDQFVKYFSKTTAFRADTDFVTENLTGINRILFSLDSGKEGGIADPDYLAAVERFGEWLRSQPGVRHVQSLADVMKRLNRNMHGDRSAFYRIPESRELAAQYLLLFEMALPQGLDLRNQVSVDRSASRVVAILGDLASEQVIRLNRDAEAWLAREPSIRAGYGTGPDVLFSYITQRNVPSMLTGTAVALGLISLCLIVMLKSLRLGSLSMIPNAVPAVVVFGIWGLTVGEVGLTASVVTAMTLGIIVDNTIHFISKYRNAREVQGLTLHDAIRYVYSAVGPVVVGGTLILISGFLVLCLSAFQVNRILGVLTSLVIVASLLADLFLLPALLLSMDRRRSQNVA